MAYWHLLHVIVLFSQDHRRRQLLKYPYNEALYLNIILFCYINLDCTLLYTLKAATHSIVNGMELRRSRG
jgi:hypothetical protein